MKNRILPILFICCLAQAAAAQIPPALERFLGHRYMQGASCAFLAKEIHSGEILYACDAGREMPPASVLKTVTTATALELLGAGYRFATTLEYDGLIDGHVLKGNLYIRGSGDPTLGSSHFASARSDAPDAFAARWVDALKKKGIREITGSVIADESIFDSEGVSGKWAYEDLGSYYGAGCYGLSVFDNLYRLHLRTGSPGSRPEIISCVPAMPSIRFHNYLTSAAAASDSSYILGAPLSGERYLYGVLPAGEKSVELRGDIPDPPLFLAQYILRRLQEEKITVAGSATCFRLLQEENKIPRKERKTLATTYSPTLREIVRITNGRSHNLCAEALLRALGTKYTPKPGEAVSSAGKGICVIRDYWAKKGLDTSGLRMFDGSGLALSDRATASFICSLLAYMAARSGEADAFIASLPKAGMEGTVSSFLKGTALQGKALLKSGGMSGVRTYAGFITKGGKQYAVALFTCNYSCTMQEITKEMEKLLAALF